MKSTTNKFVKFIVTLALLLDLILYKWMWNFTKINDSRVEFIENDLRIGQKIDLRFYRGFAYLNLQEVRMFHK